MSLLKSNRFSSLVWWAALLFMSVWGAKLWVLDQFGSDVPCWDQWDADVLHVFVPYFDHQLCLQDFFRQHNEHRVVFTKLLNLGLLMVSGQWDPRVQCVVNAILHSSLAVAVFLFVRPLFTDRWLPALFLAIAITFGLPIARQNILGGFHSQQYLLLWFSFAAIASLCMRKAGSPVWWGGAVLAVAANFTMGSGMFASIAVASVVLTRSLLRQSPWKPTILTLTVCFIAVAVGAFSYAPTEGNAWMKAHSLQEFYRTFVHCMQWPNAGRPWKTQPDEKMLWAALIMYAPYIIYTFDSFRRGALSPIENVLIAIGVWVILQSAAMAYARSIGGAWPASRYLDSLAIGVLLNGLLLAVLIKRASQTGWLWGFRILGTAWLIMVGLGLEMHLRHVLSIDFPENRTELQSYETNVRNYLATGDTANLEGKIIPYVNSPALIFRLSHPAIRAVLPSSIREPIQTQYLPTSSGPAESDGIITSLNPDSKRGCYNLPDTGESHYASPAFQPHFKGYLRLNIITNGSVRVEIHSLANTKKDSTISSALIKRSTDTQEIILSTQPESQYLSISKESTATTLLISRPIEISTLSYLALKLVHSGWAILTVSMLGAVLLFVIEITAGLSRVSDSNNRA